MPMKDDASLNLKKLVDLIEIPPSYYDKALNRYRSLSEWFCRDESSIKKYNPIVYIQGSFGLGLVNRPLGLSEEYDLDLVCELLGLDKENITQGKLKQLLGYEIGLYARAHQLLKPPIDGKRCWRIDYADEVNFHIDNLASIPEGKNVVTRLIELGLPPWLAESAIALTCKEHPHYRIISTDWPSSNPRGYIRWFEGRFGPVGDSRRILLVESGRYKSAVDVPTFALKTPLQQVIQLLKRHRDFMFRTRNDLKPISMIITTLAAEAYEGERNLVEALTGILDRMPTYVRDEIPRIPNPVNPAEDFADKWAGNQALEENFWNWYDQARRDFAALGTLDLTQVRQLGESRLGIRQSGAPHVHTKRPVAPIVAVGAGPRPWGE